MNMPDEPGILTCVSLRYVAELFFQGQNDKQMNLRAVATAQEAAADQRREQRGLHTAHYVRRFSLIQPSRLVKALHTYYHYHYYWSCS